MTDAKKHHFVPQFLLREFAGTDQKLHVHGIDNEREFDAKSFGDAAVALTFGLVRRELVRGVSVE